MTQPLILNSSNPAEEEPQQMSFEALRCKADDYSPFVQSSEKYTVTKPCLGDGINIIDCHHPLREVFIKDAGGLDMATKTLRRPATSMPSYIQVVPRELFSRPATLITNKIVGVSLKDIFNKQLKLRNGFYQVPKNLDINQAVLSNPIFKGKKVVLLSGGIDALLEHLWWRRHEINLFDKIADMGFYAVSGINFSVFKGECPLAHAININKSLVYCQELDRRGVSTIPHVYAVNDDQRQRWAIFLNDRPNIKLVALNAQLQRSQVSAAVDAQTIRYLLEHTSVNVILQGRRRILPQDLSGSDRISIASYGQLKTLAITQGDRLTQYFRPENQVDGEASGYRFKFNDGLTEPL
jgi:hypothetical protein